MADYEFKNKNNNVKKIVIEEKDKEVGMVEEVVKNKEIEEIKVFKSKKPWFVWSAARPKAFDNLEDMIEHFLKECKQNGKVKTEFISNNQSTKLVIKKSKFVKSLNKQED